MPNLPLFAAGYGADDNRLHNMGREPPQKPSFLRSKLGSLLRRRHGHEHAKALLQIVSADQPPPSSPHPSLNRRASVPEPLQRPPLIPSESRPQTFSSQESEKRDNLLEVRPSTAERAASVDGRRKRGFSTSAVKRSTSPALFHLPSLSAPGFGPQDQLQLNAREQLSGENLSQPRRELTVDLPPLQIPDQDDLGPAIEQEEDEHDIDHTSLQEEYDRRWILNLSMHFRDKSNREKFFVTYAETLTRWRRITISLDYRIAPEGSLEADLSTLHYQRDKSIRIYEAIRESLADIQYYDTITNLKLETTPSDGQLHVHVREDANEIIQYPSASLFDHVKCRMYKESNIEFVSHLSGFVYKVKANGATVIKKEIPGPDTVDEFLYEVNALDALLGCHNVIQLDGLVMDDSEQVVKGLLISYASHGALVDMIYDFRGELPWFRREKWAKQIVQGLADIHETGFVQGDFTLSNIVIDDEDTARIIDINRRGCPVGWEPPELSRLIESGQRIGMCIGVKTDLFQLGMVLWALAEEVDEPEREDRAQLVLTDAVPAYYRRIVETCLSERPQGRVNAKRLLRYFPAFAGLPPPTNRPFLELPGELRPADYSLDNSVSTSHRSDKEYIDPSMAITLEEVRPQRNRDSLEFASGAVTYLDPLSNPASTTYRFDSSGSWVVGHRRGRSPVSSRRPRSSPFGRTASSTTSLSESPGRCSASDRADVDGNGANDTAKLPSPPRVVTSEVVDTSKALNEDADWTEMVSHHSSPPPQRVATLHDQQSTLRGLEHVDSDSEEHPPLAQRTAALHNQHNLRTLEHVDSGFDEHLVDELELAQGPRPIIEARAPPSRKEYASYTSFPPPISGALPFADPPPNPSSKSTRRYSTSPPPSVKKTYVATETDTGSEHP